MAIAAAVALGIPIAVRQKAIAASLTPMPPGDRHHPGEQADERVREQELGERGALPERADGRPRNDRQQELRRRSCRRAARRA
jgi:hypothetical protein